MSALHPKADMCRATRDVRYGPIANIALRRRRPDVQAVRRVGTGSTFGAG
jgi:hypothetical protein